VIRDDPMRGRPAWPAIGLFTYHAVMCRQLTARAAPHDPSVSMPRDKIILACSECKNRNYFSDKNKRLHPERVEWKKHCPRCNKHTLHKETK
jgi:large subunit ribosomal protein L33